MECVVLRPSAEWNLRGMSAVDGTMCGADVLTRWEEKREWGRANRGAAYKTGQRGRTCAGGRITVC